MDNGNGCETSVVEPEILSRMPGKASVRIKHNFENWADGQIRHVIHGQHFSVQMETFRNNAYHWGRANGLKAIVRKKSQKSFAIQFLPEAAE